MRNKNTVLRRLTFPLFFFFSILYSEVVFENFDLNKNGDILFSIKQKTKTGIQYKSLFLYSQDRKKIKQLSFFPEQLQLLGNNRFLQISNDNSFARLDLEGGGIYYQSEFETISQMNNSMIGSLKNIQVSPDGRWISFLDPVSPVFGRLTLIDTLTEKRFILTEKSCRNLKAIKWAPNSKTFFYEETENIYFVRTDWISSSSLPDKKFRFLAKGSIKNLSWISNDEFVFLSGTVLYEVNSNDLFTKSFYTPIFPIGKLLAKLPVDIDISSDELFISPNGKTAVFVKSKRNIYYLKLSGDDYLSVYDNGVIPFLVLPGNTAKVSVYWKNNLPVIFSESVFEGKTVSRAWEISYKNEEFTEISHLKNSKFLAASDNFKMVAIKEANGISFYDTDADWRRVSGFDDEEIVSAVWSGNNCVFLGGKNSLIRYNLETNKYVKQKEKIFLTGLEDFSWSDSKDSILIKIKNRNNNEILEYADKLKIRKTNKKELNKKSNTNSVDRIYIDSSVGYFKNMIYIRSLNNYSTRPLFIEPISFASNREPLHIEYLNTPYVFSYGKRTGKKQIALAFDAVDNIDGIAEVLYVLKKNNIKATFFINGEAIRQNPNAIKEIVKAGHQCGSMFFTKWNLNDLEYRIDENFIKQGLARNEDSFYLATNSELSLIWHSPDYVTSTMVVNAGKNAGYIYIAPDIVIPDWISENNKNSLANFNKTVPQMIEDVCNNISCGSIVPVRLGKTSPPKKEYLHSQLQLLIDVIKEMGYSITDIQTIMKK